MLEMTTPRGPLRNAQLCITFMDFCANLYGMNHLIALPINLSDNCELFLGIQSQVI